MEPAQERTHTYSEVYVSLIIALNLNTNEQEN